MVEQVVKEVMLAIQFDPFEVKKPDKLFSYEFNNTFFLLISLINEKNGVYQQGIADIDKIIALLEQSSDAAG